ncbi:MAG TPA: enoyl-CoA hydratase/isomerase family protein [Baekduia sp.]|nr:enoyl-CoA hydratase/isomerase family protein [Baekduia sp.]
MSGVVRLEHDGPLAVLTLDAPPLNLFDAAVFAGFRDAIDGLVAQPPRGVLIRAEGKVVSGGVDVGKVFDGMSPEAGGQLWAELLADVQKLEDLPCPVVFAAHGLCLTAAFEIALACDILLASERARFGLVEIVVGLTPSMGGPQRLAERAGPARAKELIFTGDLFDAETLERWNVVNRVLPAEGFDEAARAYALRIANGPTQAHAATKAIVRAQKEDGARAADAIVPEVSGALFETEDLQNAVRSFLAEGPGKAIYTGR